MTTADNGAERVPQTHHWTIELAREAWQGAAFYLCLSFPLMLALNYTTGSVNEQLSNVFDESLAPSSIMLLFTFGGIISAIGINVAGPFDPARPGNSWLYRYIVFPVVDTGKALTLTALGMIVGLGLACAVTGHFGLALLSLLPLTITLLYFLAFRAMEFIAKNGLGNALSECQAQWILWGIPVALPCVWYWAIFKP